MSFPRYPNYRESGVKWLGSIPDQWTVKKFRHVFRESAEKIEGQPIGDMLSVSGYRGIEIKEYDDNNRRRVDEDLVGYRIVRAGQLVVNTMWLNYAGLGISDFEGHVSPAYRAYWITECAERRFFHHLMRSELYVQGYTRLLTGIRPNSLQISRDDLMEFPILLPPLSDQRSIATFLDRETAKIDALVAKQRRLIELLKEKRQAVISITVTKGLNPHVPMKDSGIEWLGEVPAHWKIRRIKNISRLTTSGPRGWSERVGERGALFVQSGDLNDSLQIEFSAAKRVEVADDAESNRSRLLDGDVVICITGAKTGNVAVCTAIPEIAYVNQHLCLVRPHDDVAPAFLGAFLKSAAGQTYFELSQYGLKQGLSLEDVNDAPIALPPHKEQVAIVAHTQLQQTGFDALSIAAECAIRLLQERRAALISAAVTGQIDVRQLVENQVAA